MIYRKNKYTTTSVFPFFYLIFLWTSFCILFSCKNRSTPPPKKEIVETPQQMSVKVPEIIQQMIDQVASGGKLDDSIKLLQPALLQSFYEKSDYEARWSKEQQWLPIADSMHNFIENAKLYGLYPEDYHFQNLDLIRDKIQLDTTSRKDAVLWSKADLLMTDALVQIMHHLKLGRLQKDSITLRKDSILPREFIEQQVEKIFSGTRIAAVMDSLEPKLTGYRELKAGIRNFLDSADFRDYTHVPYPVYDTVKFRMALKQRLIEDSLLSAADPAIDSSKISAALRKFQREKKLTVDGKAGAETIRALNSTDKEKFFRIAVTLDKYKMLPDSLPHKYIWVNLAGFYLNLKEADTLRLYSKVVVGKPLTRTPELNSAISDMITYPQWTIPTSIIVKEILPGLKKDPGYLEKKGYSLLDSKNEEVDPYFIDWSKYKTGIPYKVIQGSGDDNALGVLKFNFPNKYSVYLHDTNQRYLFANKNRSLSHGCVRVQEWQKLANYILNNDSTYVVSKGKSNYTRTDSVAHWLEIKEKHYIPVRERIPLFIRYFTCEGHNGRIVFYDDIYYEDQKLKEKYFPGK